MELALTPSQFNVVSNLMSLTIAAMAGAGIFFLAAGQQVSPKYRVACVVSAVVVFIAGYHYWRIHESWHAAFVFADGVFQPSGTPFNDAYRYADWLITVPLLLVELVAVLGLERQRASRILTRLIVAAVAMLLLGYPGELSGASGTRWFYWTLSMVPFLYILFVLYTELGTTISQAKGDVYPLLATARRILVISWLFYPVAFTLPMLGFAGATGEVGLQVGYTIADLSAKALYGVYIYRIAKAKSDVEAADALPAGLAQAA